MEDRPSPRCWTAPPGLPGVTLRPVYLPFLESWTSSRQSPQPSQDVQLSCCCLLLFSHVWPSVTPCSTRHTPLSSTLSWGLLEFISFESVILSNHLILCRPLLLLTPIPPSIRVFSNELALYISWAKDWSCSFSNTPSKEYFQGWFPLGLPGLISLLSKGLSRVFSGITVQNIDSSALNLPYVQFLHLDMTTGATTALTLWTFVSKVMALIFNMLSRFVMGFPSDSDGKESTCNADLIPGLGRSPGEGNSYPL